MADLTFPTPKTPLEFLYRVQRGARKVEKVRVVEIAPKYVRVVLPGSKHTRREAWLNRHHTYFYHFEQAHTELMHDYSTKIKCLRRELAVAEQEMCDLQLTEETDI